MAENNSASSLMSAYSENQTRVAGSGFWQGVHPAMAITSLLMILAFLAFTILDVEFANSIYVAARDFVQQAFDWYYVLVVNIIFFFALWLLCSRFGKIKLGQDEDQPEFSRFAWFAMLFSAGVGTGLLFWSIAEPILHFQGNPFGDMAGVAPESEQAARVALRTTLFHWGLHGWAIYSTVGLCLGYFSFRRGLPLTIRSALYPLIGDRIYGGIGHLVDLLAIFGTVFGVATTLGLGVVQINSGLNYLFGIEISTTNQVITILVISIITTAAVVSGLNRGIRILSEINIWCSVVLVGFVLIAGPTLFILGYYLSGIGDYLVHFLPMGIWTDPDPEGGWQGTWTLFYWGWWLSWGPFVGMFMARISRGRTIREYVLGTLLAPTLLGFLWLSVFGGTALHMELFAVGGLIEAVNRDLTFALYETISLLGVNWATWAVSALATFLIVTWFVTSSNSGTLVICTMLSMGDANPPTRFRVFWGMGQGLVAAALLLAGGLSTLQAASLIVALPFSVVILLMYLGLYRSLRAHEVVRVPS